MFQRATISLSFKLQGTNDRLVISIWWPKKLNFVTKDLNSYSLSWLRIISTGSREDTEKAAAIELKKLVTKADKNVKDFPSSVIQVDNYQSYRIWQFPILNPLTTKVDRFLNVLTNMGDARKNGMTVKVQLEI